MSVELGAQAQTESNLYSRYLDSFSVADFADMPGEPWSRPKVLGVKGEVWNHLEECIDIVKLDSNQNRQIRRNVANDDRHFLLHPQLYVHLTLMLERMRLLTPEEQLPAFVDQIEAEKFIFEDEHSGQLKGSSNFILVIYGEYQTDSDESLWDRLEKDVRKVSEDMAQSIDWLRSRRD